MKDYRTESWRRTRIAFVVGTLGRGGAEKQCVLLAQALTRLGSQVRLYTLTRGEFYESVLRETGIGTVWIGRRSSPFLRLLRLSVELHRFRPHVVQATHFFVNAYVGLVARLYGSVGVGAVRSNVHQELEIHRYLGPFILRMTDVLVANSQAACANAVAAGLDPGRVLLLENVIDLDEFDRRRDSGPPSDYPCVAVTVANPRPAKRLDRFLGALTLARKRVDGLVGMIVGEGPSICELKDQARKLGLLPDGVLFLGQREDVPALLSRAQIFVLTSDHEGFPNVLLEAMAAGLPVITTPAGDSARIVENGRTGYVVDFDDVQGTARRIETLATSEETRRAMGRAGRCRVARRYSTRHLPLQIAALYSKIARRAGRPSDLEEPIGSQPTKERTPS